MTVSQLIQALSMCAPGARVMFFGPSTSGGDYLEVKDTITREDDHGIFIELTDH